MVYSSNVSNKNKGYGIFWFEEYTITLVFVWDIRGIYHTPCCCLRHSRNISYPLFLSAKFQEYTITPVFFLVQFQTKTCGMIYFPNVSEKTRTMVYSSNVSDKNKGNDILLECLRQKRGLWYTPQYIEESIIPLVIFWDIRGVQHNPCFCLRHSRSISYLLFLSEIFAEYTITLVFVWDMKNKGHDIFFECLTQKQGLWYTPRMCQTKTRGMIYS
jgi:hypothetical protein